MGCCQTKPTVVQTDNEQKVEEVNKDTDRSGDVVQIDIDDKKEEKQNDGIAELFGNIDEELDDDNMDIANRKSVQRIIRILNIYEEWRNNEHVNKKHGIIDYLETKLSTNQYNTIKLLNDYQDIITLPNHNDQFEDIYLLIIKHISSCNHTDCHLLSRNNRNREICRNNNQQRIDMYFGHNGCMEINFQQILDKIHCYFLHSFDRTYRMKRNEMEQIQNEIKQNKDNDDDEEDDKEKDDEQATKTLFAVRKLMETKNRENGSTLNTDKFVSTQKSIPLIVAENEIDDDVTNKNDEKKDENKEEEMMVYSFGYRYFYWDYYKNNTNRGDYREKTNSMGDGTHNAPFQDWYIPKKHESLKEELLNNVICTISNEQWQSTFERAECLNDTKWCKQNVIANWNPNWEIEYDVRFKESNIKNGDQCQVHHLMVILLYTNYDFLQRKFTETYRKLDGKESNDALKERHSNFANWGKYIREMVEVFGFRLSGSYFDHSDKNERNWNWREYKHIGINRIYNTFYHGINAEMLFVATIGRLCGPTSTTIAIAVAINFTKSTGLCLTLERHSYDSHLRYVNCSVLSDYTNEQEMLFLGGYQPIKFKTIINTKELIDYKIYLRALNQINFFLTGSVEKIKRNKNAFRNYTKKKDAVIIYKLITNDTIFNPKINVGRNGYLNYEHQKLKNEIPAYIKTLFRFYCDNIDHIIIDLKETFSNHRQFANIFIKGFAESQYGYNNRSILNIDLELICKLFKNIKWIEITDTNQAYNNNPLFERNPNQAGSHMSGDNRIVLKDAWFNDLKQFFRNKVIVNKYNKYLKKIIFKGNALNQNGDITVDIMCTKRVHELIVGQWKLMPSYGKAEDLVFVKC